MLVSRLLSWTERRRPLTIGLTWIRHGARPPRSPAMTRSEVRPLPRQNPPVGRGPEWRSARSHRSYRRACSATESLRRALFRHWRSWSSSWETALQRTCSADGVRCRVTIRGGTTSSTVGSPSCNCSRDHTTSKGDVLSRQGVCSVLKKQTDIRVHRSCPMPVSHLMCRRRPHAGGHRISSATGQDSELRLTSTPGGPTRTAQKPARKLGPALGRHPFLGPPAKPLWHHVRPVSTYRGHLCKRGFAGSNSLKYEQKSSEIQKYGSCLEHPISKDSARPQRS